MTCSALPLSSILRGIHQTGSSSGRWRNGVYHGRGTLTYASGKQMTGNFWNGVPDGVFHVTERDGSFSTPRFSREEPWKVQ